MAKALIGHLNSDLRSTAELSTENRRLRQRVVELESLVLRLKEENDALADASATAMLDSHESTDLQPV